MSQTIGYAKVEADEATISYLREHLAEQNAIELNAIHDGEPSGVLVKAPSEVQGNMQTQAGSTSRSGLDSPNNINFGSAIPAGVADKFGKVTKEILLPIVVNIGTNVGTQLSMLGIDKIKSGAQTSIDNWWKNKQPNNKAPQINITVINVAAPVQR
jgi:hypothetical protein